MLLRARLIRGILAVLCVAAALNFGLTSLSGGLVELHHYVHGDQASGDGGWIIADTHEHQTSAHLADHQNIGSDTGHTDADGHHHHSTSDHAGAGLPATSEKTFTPGPANTGEPALARTLDGADPGRNGPVPRTETRIV